MEKWKPMALILFEFECFWVFEKPSFLMSRPCFRKILDAVGNVLLTLAHGPVSVEHPGVALCFGGPKGLGTMENPASRIKLWQVSIPLLTPHIGWRSRFPINWMVYGGFSKNFASTVWRFWSQEYTSNLWFGFNKGPKCCAEETPYEGGWSWT